MGNHGAAGVSQNSGILIVVVYHQSLCHCLRAFALMWCMHSHMCAFACIHLCVHSHALCIYYNLCAWCSHVHAFVSHSNIFSNASCMHLHTIFVHEHIICTSFMPVMNACNGNVHICIVCTCIGITCACIGIPYTGIWCQCMHLRGSYACLALYIYIYI